MSQFDFFSFDWVNIGLFSMVAVFTMLILKSFLKPLQKEETEQSKVKLEDLSALLWAKGKEEGQLKIEDLAPIWKEIEVKEVKEESITSFNNPIIQDFYLKYIEEATWFKKARLQKEVCLNILGLLDKEGDCPSVVNANDDVEASWDSNTFTILGQVNLTEHTLNVAVEAVNLLLSEEAQHVIPDTMVAALGHDLGKLPSIKSHLYSLGEHPLAAGRVLAEIASFKKLNKKQEISKAIKLHHKRPEGLLGKTLKKADQTARQNELEYTIEKKQQKQEKPVVQPESSDSNSPPETSPSTSSNVANAPVSSPPVQGTGAAWKAQADIFGEEPPQEEKKEKVNQIDISSWFDAQDFLDELNPYINRITGRRFMAFSMSDGYVFVQAKAIEEVARKMAERNGAMDIATMAADDPTMRRVLFTVVNHLRVNHEVIAREFIKDQYFGGYFNITMKGGKKMKGFYTPFHAEAFGSIGEMENQKTGILKNFKKVEPFSE